MYCRRLFMFDALVAVAVPGAWHQLSLTFQGYLDPRYPGSFHQYHH